MDETTIKKAEEIFQLVVDLPTEQRERALAERCAGDADLRTFVEQLLSHDATGMGEFLCKPVFTPVPNDAVPMEEAPPERIGRYRIIRAIGEGGMGVVYLAEQTEPVRRQVALKLIKLGMDTKQVIARFESERQALALMNHPNIARVYDAGATENGRPFFVMEYVPGIAVTKFCDAERLTVRERLELFMEVCHGLHHAHQNGVIHRDIKPSNLLVAQDNDRPTPKIIDFGVAKAISERLTERTLFTEQGQIIGTPAYMSPEQTGGDVANVDTRSDIYSLGALLYELLTGSPPFDPAKLRLCPFDEICRTIREEEPPRPSTKFGEAVSGAAARSTGLPPTEAADIVLQRGTDAPSLRKQLRGDLDWITMKAMEKDRSRRYESASALAADIQRHLNHEPVAAGPPSTAYRVKKFIRRNRAFVTGMAAVFVVLVAGTVSTTMFALGQARARDEAEAARDQAQRQTGIAQAVNDFLNYDLLAAVSPEDQGRDVTVREVLDRASETIGGRFESEPLVEASIRTTLATTYRELGEYERAEPHLLRALELRHGILGDEHLDTLVSMNEIAINYMDRGRYGDAAQRVEKILEVTRRVHGDDHIDTLTTGNNLAVLYAKMRRFEEAEPLYKLVLEGRLRTVGEEHPDTLSAVANLGTLYSRWERFDKAEPLLVQALEARRRVLGDEHPKTLGMMRNLAIVQQGLGRLEDAESLLLQANDASRRVLGEEHPHALLGMHNLAHVYRLQGRLEDAESLYEKTLDALQRVLGEEHPVSLTCRHNLGVLYGDNEEYGKAEPLLTETLNARRRVLGETHPDTLATAFNLAVTHDHLGQYDEADTLFATAVTGARSAFQPGDKRIGMHLAAHGALLIKVNRYEQAQDALLEAYDILESAVGPADEQTIQVVRNSLKLYEAWGKPDKAAEWHELAPESLGKQDDGE